MVEAKAEVWVNPGTTIEAEGNLEITAEADAYSSLKTIGYGIGVTYTESTAQADVLIVNAENAAATNLSATNELKLKAKTSNTVENSIKAGINDVDITLSMTDASSTSNAYIEKGAIVSAGRLEVAAENVNSIETSGEPVEVIGGSSGGAVALSRLDSKAKAYVNTDVTTTGDVMIHALSQTDQNKTSTSSDPLSLVPEWDTIVPKVRQFFSKSENKPDQDSKRNDAWDVSSAVTLSDNLNQAEAYIGSKAIVRSQDKIEIKAETVDNFQQFAVAESEQANFAVSAAVAIGSYENKALAYIDDNADVAAQKDIDITAKTEVPNQFDFSLSDFIPGDFWEALGLAFNFEDAITDGIFTSYIRSATTDVNTAGLSGSVNIMFLDNWAEAYIGESAQVNQDLDPLYHSVDQSVNILAKNDVETINLVGVFTFGLNPLGTSGKASLGGSYNQVNYGNNTRAYIKDGAQVSAVKDITVKADSDESIYSITVSGGKAEDFGISGAFSKVYMENESLAFIEDKALVQAGNDLTITAEDLIKNLNITGGFVKAENIGVGASVALNDIDSATKAFIGDYNLNALLPVGSIVADNDIFLTATTDNTIGSFSLAGVFVSDSGQQPPDEDVSNDSDDAGKGKEQKGSFGLGISGDVSLNTIESDTFAYIDDNADVTAGFDLDLEAKNQSEINAIAGSVAFAMANKNGSSSGIAGSVTINKIFNKTKAYIEDALISVGSLAVDPTTEGLIDMDAISTGEIDSICAAAAGGNKVGLAGSVSYNETENETSAAIKDTTVSAVNTVTMDAKDDTEINTIAGAVGFGKDAVGLGTAVAINLIENDIKTTIDHSVITASKDLILNSKSLNDIFAVAGSAGLGRSGALSGSMSWNDISNDTHAAIINSDDSNVVDDINAGGLLTLSSLDDSNIQSISGALSIGKVGIGAAGAYNDISDTLKTYIDASDVHSTGALSLSSVSDSDIETIAAGGALASQVTLSGAVSINDIDNDLYSYITNFSDVSSDASVSISAQDISQIRSLSGAVSISGRVAVGAAVSTNEIGNDILAYISASDVSAGDELTISADEDADIETISAEGSGSGSVSLGGSISLNEIHNNVLASILNSPNSIDAVNDIKLIANDTSNIWSLSGNIGLSGTAALGAAFASNDISNTIGALIDMASLTSQTGNIYVMGLSENEIETIAVSGQGAGSLAIAGSIAINIIENDTQAAVKNAELTADDNVIVCAVTDNEIDFYGGTLAISGTAGIGGTVAVNTLANKTQAYINQGSAVQANGTDSVAVLKTDGTIGTEDIKGVAVLALSKETVELYTANLSGGGTVGVAANVGVTNNEDETYAYIDNATVNADLSQSDQDQIVRVAAFNQTSLDTLAGGLAFGGTAGIGATANISTIENITQSYINNAPLVQANKGVEVTSVTREEIDAITVSGAGAGTVGVAGSVPVLIVENTNEAFISKSMVNSQGDLSVIADDNVTIDLIAGSAAIGGVGGVGGSVVVTDITNETRAFIANATTNARQKTQVLAKSRQDLGTYAATGSLGGYLGAAGSVLVNTIETTTEAFITESADDTKINQDLSYDNTQQDVDVIASNTAIVDNLAGVVAVAFMGAGVGASIDISSIKNTTTAYIGGGTEVHAGHDVNVQAAAYKQVDSSVMAFGGGIVGVQGAVTVINVGSAMSADGADAAENTAQAANEQASGSAVGDQMGTSAQALRAKAIIDQQTNNISVSDEFNQSAAVTNATSAYIGSNADVSAGNNITVDADEVVTLDLSSGAGSGGLVGAGGAVSIASIQNRVNAYVDDHAVLSAEEDIIVTADADVLNTDIDSFAGTAGAVGLGAAVSMVDSVNSADAHIGQAQITKADEITIAAKTTADLDANAFGASFGALAVGVVLAEAVENGITRAYLDGNAQLGVPNDTTQQVNSLSIFARSINNVVADTTASSGGIFSGNGSDADAEVAPTVEAYISDAQTPSGAPLIIVQNDIEIEAEAQSRAVVEADGLSIGGLAVGVSLADVAIRPTIAARIGDNVSLQTGGHLMVEARHNFDENGQVIYQGGTADSSASSGALIGIAATDATATGILVLESEIGDNTYLDVEEDIDILSKSYLALDANTTGFSGGIAAVGSNTSSATMASAVQSSVGKNATIQAKNLTVDAYAINDTFSYAQAGAGGVVAGAASTANTNQFNSTKAYIDDSDETHAGEIETDDDVVIHAFENSVVNAKSDSSSAGFVGMSGARINNSVVSNVSAYVGKNNRLNVGRDLNITALNWTTKYDLSLGFNIDSGAGGFIGGSAGEAVTSILNSTVAMISGNTSPSADKTISVGNDLVVLADTDVLALDKGKLETGGLIGIADVQSKITNVNVNQAVIGENANVEVMRDAGVYTRTDTNVEAITNTHTYGLGASGDGKGQVNVTVDNDTIISSNATVTAGRHVNIYAGQGPDNVQNILRDRGEARSWVSGGIPLSSVKGWAYLFNYNDVTVQTGAEIYAGRDINIGSMLGLPFVQGYAKAKKKTYLLFGIPITIWSNGSRRSILQTSDNVIVKGTLESGLNKHKGLYIDVLGQVDPNSTIDYQRINNIDAVAELSQRILDLEAQILEEQDLILLLVLAEEKLRVEAKLQQVLDKRNDPVNPDPNYGFFDRIIVADAAVETGDINVTGKLSGDGTLKSPGNDFRIEVINDSTAHLEIHDLVIPEGVSGKVFLNGSAITSHQTVNIVQGLNTQPQITVRNTYVPGAPNTDPDAWADIILKGNITNYGAFGKVWIKNTAGSIESFGNILADDIKIDAAGEFIQNYVTGVLHQDTVIAGSNISISAEILNIRGTIQSGDPDRQVIIPAFDPASLTDNVILMDANSNILAVWDEDLQKIQVYPIKVSGGNISLFGEIVSTTGTGQIKVIDGYGQIHIENNSNYDVVINTLDAGSRINGKIFLTDTGKLDSSGYPLLTVYSREGGLMRIEENYKYYDKNLGEIILLPESLSFLNDKATVYQPRIGAEFVEIALGEALSNKYGDDLSSYGNQVQQGDQPIGIEFIGFGAPTLDVINNGSGDVYLNSLVKNIDADVTITNTGGSILSLSENSVVIGRNIDLSAGLGDIGSSYHSVNIDTKGGSLKANSGGAVHIEEIEGDLTIAQVYGTGSVKVIADGSIWSAPATDAVLVGADVTLESLNGGIGSSRQNFIMDAEGILTAEAQESIYITEKQGDMLVNRVASRQGDVQLISAGSIEDYNLANSFDDDVLADLNPIVSEMALQDETEQQAAGIDQYKAQKKAEYDAAHTNDNGTPDDPTDDFFDSTYDPNWEYVLTAEEEKQFEDTLWTDEELVGAKNSITLPDDIPPEIILNTEDANVSGRNITLISNGTIGTFFEPEVIPQADIASGNLTDAQRDMLTRAEKDDLLFDGTEITVFREEDFNIEATGRVDVVAPDYLFLDAKLTYNGVDRRVVSDNKNTRVYTTDHQLFVPRNTPFFFYLADDITLITNALAVKYSDDVITNIFSTENSAFRLSGKFLSVYGYSRSEFSSESLQNPQTVNVFWAPMYYHEISTEDQVIYDELDEELEEYFESLDDEAANSADPSDDQLLGDQVRAEADHKIEEL